MGIVYKERELTLEEYIEEKIEILGDMCIELDETQLEYIRSLGDEMSVDRYAHKLIIGEDD